MLSYVLLVSLSLSLPRYICIYRNVYIYMCKTKEFSHTYIAMAQPFEPAKSQDKIGRLNKGPQPSVVLESAPTHQ